MDFPEKLDDIDLDTLIHEARKERINPIYTDGQVVVPSPMEATKVALFSKGKVVAKYQLRGDGTWRRTSSPQL